MKTKLIMTLAFVLVSLAAANAQALRPIEAVDLGLSVKWATANVGAKTEADWGTFYRWKDIDDKYNPEWFSQYAGMATSSFSGTEHDVARIVMGSPWRMPTQEEWEELQSKCTWTWTQVDMVSGMKVTGPNGNAIFLPAAGYIWMDEYQYPTRDQNAFGHYWSATLVNVTKDIHYVYECDFDKKGIFWSREFLDAVWYPIRSVQDR